ncbi:MAG: glycosyltransferase family 4 protein [Vicinamibacterales bacterium]
MMRVLYPLNSHQIGGGNRSMLTLWAGLRSLDVEPRAVAPDVGPMVDACAEAGVRCSTSSYYMKPTWREPWRSLTAYRYWTKLVATTSPVLVHTNGFWPSQAIALAASRAGLPHVCHVRFAASRAYLDWVFRGLPKPDLFILNSQALANELQPALEEICRSSRFEVVYNAVDLNLFRPAPRTPGPLRIGIVANLIPVKGHEDFLRMAQTLQRRHVDAQFWVIGGDIYDTGYDAALRNLAAQLGVDGAVTFFGHRSDVPTLVSQLDVLVCASHEEPFGRCLIEAMACGKPVVATRVGGIPEVVDDGVTGVLVPPRSPGDLADAVEHLLQSPLAMTRLGEAARARASELFSSEAHALRVKSIYDRVVR